MSQFGTVSNQPHAKSRMATSKIKFKGFGEWEVISSLPYTPTSDGILVTYVSPSSSATAQYILDIDGLGQYFRTVSYNGINVSNAFPIKYGQKVSLVLSSGLDSGSRLFFIPLI